MEWKTFLFVLVICATSNWLWTGYLQVPQGQREDFWYRQSLPQRLMFHVIVLASFIIQPIMTAVLWSLTLGGIWWWRKRKLEPISESVN
jgi:hypothetical protein